MQGGPLAFQLAACGSGGCRADCLAASSLICPWLCPGLPKGDGERLEAGALLGQEGTAGRPLLSPLLSGSDSKHSGSCSCEQSNGDRHSGRRQPEQPCMVPESKGIKGGSLVQQGRLSELGPGSTVHQRSEGKLSSFQAAGHPLAPPPQASWPGRWHHPTAGTMYITRMSSKQVINTQTRGDILR